MHYNCLGQPSKYLDINTSFSFRRLYGMELVFLRLFDSPCRRYSESWSQNSLGHINTHKIPFFDHYSILLSCIVRLLIKGKFDSRTGISQIFRRTAITARNRAVSVNLISDELPDPNDWYPIALVWDRLCTDTTTLTLKRFLWYYWSVSQAQDSTTLTSSYKSCLHGIMAREWLLTSQDGTELLGVSRFPRSTMR